MTESAARLIGEMTGDVEVWRTGLEVPLEPKYRGALESVGAVPFMAELFRRRGDATLSHWLIQLAFFWKDLSFADWKQVLYRISDDATVVYRLVPFFTEFLAIDVVRMIREDPGVHETARIFAAAGFPDGGPKPGSAWVSEICEEQGIDIRRLWRRLADEGAPMKVDRTQIE